MISKYKYSLALFGSARRFLESAVRQACERDAGEWKLAILHTATALELLAKARIAFKNPHLIARGKVDDLRFDRDYFFSDNDGPIYYVGAEDDNQRIPVDPWGSPYILLDFRDSLFRTALLDTFGVETSYRQRVIFSLGPDGIPGSFDVNGAGFDSTDPFYYMVPFRLNQGGVLGDPDSDDLEFIF